MSFRNIDDMVKAKIHVTDLVFQALADKQVQCDPTVFSECADYAWSLVECGMSCKKAVEEAIASFEW